MKLLVIIPSFYPAIVYGGPIYSSLFACEELAKIGVAVKVCTTNANGNQRLKIPINEFISHEGIKIKYYNDTIVGRLSLPMILGIIKDIKEAEVVHIQSIFSAPTPISLFYSSIYHKTVVLSPRGSLGDWCLRTKRSFLKSFWLTCFILPFKHRIIWHATSEQERNEILSIDKSANVRIIPNGFEIGIKSNSSSIAKSQKKIIISMGRIHEKKGFDILIQAFVKILDIFPDSFLLIAGKDDGAKNNLLELISSYKLNNKIFFVDHIEGSKKNEFLSNADVFVLPSHNENFGNVYAEALAAGTPIVASTNTPWEEVEVADCGRWVPNTVEDTADAILNILSRDREQLRQNALRYVQKYNWKNIALEFKQLYESLL